VAGDGSQEEALRERVNSSGLAGAVHLLGFRTDAFALLNASDVFVLPSFAEPFGLVLLEAMAFSKPVVAVDRGGPSEIVVNGSTGLLAPSPDAAAIADALMEVLADPALQRCMGQAGRVRYVEQFTTERMARATADLYRRVLGGHPVPADPADSTSSAAAETHVSEGIPERV
jgi:glycosyltransferase involved in cell wall biosynthesis